MLSSLTLVLSGQAGQGLKTIETLIVNATKKQYHVFSTTEVMSRVRGGNNTVEIRISSNKVYAFKDKIDLLFLLNDHAYDRISERITDQTLVFGEIDFLTESVKSSLGKPYETLSIGALAKEAGNSLYGNTVIFGFISGLLSLDKDSGKDLLAKKFRSKSENVLKGNHMAYELGYVKGQKFSHVNTVKTCYDVKENKIINGTEAIAIGALAGGVNYIASYPMSPATGVLQFLASKGNEFDIIVEQAEDEIAALNMVIGAWYAGARAMATTSGGGLALMEEALSLAGITETPAVVHVAQRPGPGTGLPTRTEQGDLNLLVYAGHGEFPRIVLAPGTLEEGILLTQRAFYLADKFQIPVFILSDQYYIDSKAPVTPVTLDQEALKSFVVPSEKNYLRYKFTENGISPRSIPGFGDGLVKCDSDEHDEEGTITEDFNIRIKMNDKRLGKEKLILQDYIPPELVGPKNYKKLIIGWGSTYGLVKEAIESNDVSETAFLHIKEVFPLHKSIKAFASEGIKVAVIENNARGQLADLLKLHLSINADERLLKYNGAPFTIEEVTHFVKEVF